MKTVMFSRRTTEHRVMGDIVEEPHVNVDGINLPITDLLSNMLDTIRRQGKVLKALDPNNKKQMSLSQFRQIYADAMEEF